MARRIGLTWDSLVEKIKDHCVVDVDTCCWVWQHATTDENIGYAVARIEGTKWRLSRAIMHKLTGELHPVAMHSCDNPPCCNPDHLRWGTHRQNTQDASQKGRLLIGDANPAHAQREKIARGERSGTAKLTIEQVLFIRKLREDGLSYTEITKRVETSVRNVRNIVERKSWRHV